MADNINEEPQVVNATTEEATDKKCPNCGATVVYDPATLSMSCPFCGYSRKLPNPEDGGQDVEELDFESAKIRASLDWGENRKSLVCKNCGAETMFNSADTAACCPYCGSTQVMPVDNDENVMAPGGVVPFEITKEKAADLFKRWLKGKLFAPGEAKKTCEARNFSGVYLPFWTYDSQTTTSYSARLSFEKGSGDNRRVEYRTYNGIYEKFIDDEVVYASKKTDNPYVSKVSKFNFAKLRKYSPEFIAGFLAERYTVGLDDGWTTAKAQIKAELIDEIGQMEKAKHNADGISSVKTSTSYANVTFKYVLAPIWIAAFTFKDKVYNFVVNGQTGEVSGKSPVSPFKVAIAVAIALVVLYLIYRYLS